MGALALPTGLHASGCSSSSLFPPSATVYTYERAVDSPESTRPPTRIKYWGKSKTNVYPIFF